MALDADSGRMPLQRGVPALLQAVGQLLIAMAGADFPEYEAPPPPPRWTPTARRRQAPPEPPPREPPADDVELVLADARARAHKLIEDSVIRAQELLHGRGSGDWQLLERVRGTVSELTSEVRSLHERLDGIEALLREARAPAPVPPAPAEATAEEEPAPEPPPPPEAYEPPPAPYEPPPAPYERPHAVYEPPAAPEPPASEAPPPEPVEPPPAVAPPFEPVAPSSTNGSAAAAGVRFAPEDGSVLLRVAPVAGFQGLMRVQDALVRLPPECRRRASRPTPRGRRGCGCDSPSRSEPLR